MKRLGVAGVVATLVVVGSLQPDAAAADGDGSVDADANGNAFGIHVEEQAGADRGQPTGQRNDADPSGSEAPLGADPCDTYVLNSDGTWARNGCASLPESVAPRVTGAMVLSALRQTVPPQSILQVQPPNGRTLVNFETNFFTVQPEFTRTMNMLGQQVQLQIWPSQFVWRFGDGESMKTSSPGAKYPHLDVTHNYLAKGRYQPRVDTVYAAQFRVGGGAWQQVNGTVAVPGPPVDLQAVEATPKLVG